VPSGIILCRHREVLMSAFKVSASYFQWSEHRDGMNFRPSMSARARVIELWAVLKTLGREGVRRLIERLCENARSFAGLLSEQGFQIHNDLFLTKCSPHVTTTSSRERRYRISRVPVNAGVAGQPGMEERSSESVFAIGRRRQNRSSAPCALS
jgi:glutamate/tyrosine decarboxylase-like PLP-dependent enzyme